MLPLSLLRVGLLSLLLLVVGRSGVSAERQYDDIVFSEALCDEKLKDSSAFDVCAEIEFCEDPTAELPPRNDRRRRRLHEEYSPRTAQSAAEMEESFSEQAEVAEHKHKHEKGDGGDHDDDDDGADAGSLSRARFGWRLPGKECLWPGPVMRLRRGYNHGLFVRGSGGNSTNLHFHGLHTSGDGNGDDIRREVQGGNVLIYGIDIPATAHMGGTHWYHSHLTGKAWDQILGGAYGMIVVSDGTHEVGTEDPNVLAFLENERIMVLDDTRLVWSVNGVHASGTVEEYSFVKDEWYRLRVLMVGTDGHSSGAHLTFGEGCEVRAIAHDGIFRFEVPKEAQRVFALTSSSRLDVAIRCWKDTDASVYGETVSKFVVEHKHEDGNENEKDDDDEEEGHGRRLGDGNDHEHEHDHDHGHDHDGGVVPSPFEKGNHSWKSFRPPYLEDLRERTVDNTWDLRVKGKSLNDKVYDPEKPLCNEDGTDFEYGSLQEWTLHGTRQHPLHVHLYPMQVVTDYCGDGHDTGEYYDSILSDVYMRSQNYPCKVRAHLLDVSGPVLAHCHILFHAERGAQGWFHVVNGPKQPDEPRVYSCDDGSLDCDPSRVFKKCME